jgi:hypothetical protein
VILKCRIQQSPLFNIKGQQIYFTGNNPQSLQLQFGSLPVSRQWQNYGQYIDVTDSVSDLYSLKITFTEDRDDTGTSQAGAFQPSINTSSPLNFEGEAYQLIKSWLIDDISAPLNRILVQVEHVGCGTYEDFTIKASDLVFCDDANKTCTFNVVLKKHDEALNCMQNTLITDNHLGWFPENSQIPANGKKYPRFSYCNEIRPNGQLVMLWYVGSITWGITGALMVGLYLAINSILFAINGIIAVINAVINFINSLGGNINNVNPIKMLDPQDIVRDYEQRFIESAGCGREHPAPLVRDYVYNVCSKCGIDTNLLANTAPLLFAPNIHVNTSDGGIDIIPNEYYNLTYFNAPVKRGIRRFENITPFGTNPPNVTDFWIPENAPFMTLDMFLDQIKGVFNAEWRIAVVNGKPSLYFVRKDFYVDNSPFLDFTENGADRNLLIEGVCFEPNELRYYASCVGIYQGDATDVCGNEAKVPMNGYPVVFGQTDVNPIYNGMLSKEVQFGATKFRLDGHSTDYILDAMQVVVNSSFILAFNILSAIKGIVAPAFSRYADFAILLKDETASLPKLIIWDGADYLNARAVRTRCGAPDMPLPTPEINQYYNNYPTPTPWWVRYPPKTRVLSGSLTLGGQVFGRYVVQDVLGIDVVNQPAILLNYPMYFEAGYKGTLWHRFHWIDDPNRNPKQLYTWTAKIELCCANLDRTEAFNKGATGRTVKLPLKWYTNGVLKEITVDYETSDLGQHIMLRGTS